VGVIMVPLAMIDEEGSVLSPQEVLFLPTAWKYWVLSSHQFIC